MFKLAIASKWALLNALFAVLVCSVAQAAAPQLATVPSCPLPAAGKSGLALFIPNTYQTGLAMPAVVKSGTTSSGTPITHNSHFNSVFQCDFAPFNVALATELTSLPIASPASGFTWMLNPKLGLEVPTQQSFGPIQTERAETIGRHRLLFGFTFQHFQLDTLDGVKLRNFNAVFKHSVDSVTPGTTDLDGTCPNETNKVGNCLFETDFVTTQNSIDLKVNQSTLYATFGLSDRVDVSLAVPILSVRMGIFSSAVIHPNASGQTVENKGALGPCPLVNGVCHLFENGTTSTQFSGAKSATGIGDITFRIKGTVWKGERTGVAIGGDLRLPTGDEMNFLGSGALGVRPFLALSRTGRVSPHGNVGFEVNTRSVLGGNVTTGLKGRLPNTMFYSGGVDIGALKKLTLVADYLGERIFGSQRMSSDTFTSQNTQEPGTFADIQFFPQSRSIDNLSLGFKWNAIGRVLISGNAIIKLDDGGLRSKVIPLVGVSYSF